MIAGSATRGRCTKYPDISWAKRRAGGRRRYSLPASPQTLSIPIARSVNKRIIDTLNRPKSRPGLSFYHFGALPVSPFCHSPSLAPHSAFSILPFSAIRALKFYHFHFAAGFTISHFHPAWFTVLPTYLCLPPPAPPPAKNHFTAFTTLYHFTIF